ncbi:hypothetical protein Q8A67_006308 [Cirrhinus molitorella]|uniref:NACHT domain-containing protein n=1 Tax=Cirrhinus molitorella TaxID=172907 RepID=A0AA88Q7M4_9TELE|nr:hypothetical protein Q8A67_006308 [Cirrhinus molitorella]
MAFRHDTQKKTVKSLIQEGESDLPEHIDVSVRKKQPMDVSEEDSSVESSQKHKGPESHTAKKNLDSIFKELEHKIISELKSFKRLLSPDYPECSERDRYDDEGHSRVREGLLKITLLILRKMNQTDLANTLQTKLMPVYQQKLKSRLQDKYQRISEGMSNHGDSTRLNEIYTELYITEGGSGEVNNEHEVRQIETVSRRPETQETPINCNDIFKPSPGQDKPIRTVLTKGVAGIGKTVSVQKFILDWAEGKANQDVHFIFPLPFRELNLIQKRLSLVDLLNHLHKETTEFKSADYDDYKVMFIFDGLDECRLRLDFQNNQSLSDVTESASVDVLLTNLIKGNLLPSALLWITSRPAAANQIPPECVDQVTEVRGFNDPQKDEYFRKRINDQSLADRVVTHIRSSRSLFIMCHIPVFCWISAAVLERMMGKAESAEIPKTLTQMFTHFLIFQTKLKTQKYDGKYEVDPDQARKTILSLGKLAFEQLEKGNLIFYEEDLKESGIDVREVSVYSGVCTQIFRQEFGLQLGKVYSFVHLSIQEFLAALFKLLSFSEQNTGLRNVFRSPMTSLLKREVDKALQSENGHWDLFLRFLLGLSLESNQTLLQGLLRKTVSSSDINQETAEYIKQKIRENPSPEKSINLFHCLNELNDRSLEQEVQTYLNRTDVYRRLSGVQLSAAQWSALVFVLLNSEKELDEFILSKYDPSEECLLRLLPVIKASRKIELIDCSIGEEGCAALISALRSNPSHLRELDLSRNKPGDSGVNLLCALLEDPHCKLETLRLYDCSIGEEGCAALISALRSNPSHLRELNLSDNKPGDSGVNQLCALLEDPHCKLEKLRLRVCSIEEEGCAALISALRSNPSHLRELDLSANKPGDSGVNLLCALLQDPHCKLEKLWLIDCSIEEEGCAALISALRSNPSHLRELDLSRNKPGDSGVNLLCALLEDPHCKLEKLWLYNCSIEEEGCAALILALRSNSSHLRELDLSRNKPGDSGVNLLCALLEDPHCKLEKLRLYNCSIEEEGCAALISALRSNPSHLRELNLRANKPGDSGVNQLCALLQDPHCKLEKLWLYNCSIEEEGCAALISALRSNPSHLRELDLSLNKPGDSGVNLLCALLEDPHCKLEKLWLNYCRIEEEGCAALISALRSNPSHLRELDLSFNKPGDSGVKLLCALLEDPHCKLETLWLENCSIEEEGCAALISALRSNSSHLRELDLRANKPGDSGVKLHTALLNDPHCKLEKLHI